MLYNMCNHPIGEKYYILSAMLPFQWPIWLFVAKLYSNLFNNESSVAKVLRRHSRPTLIATLWALTFAFALTFATHRTVSQSPIDQHAIFAKQISGGHMERLCCPAARNRAGNTLIGFQIFM